MAAFVPEAFCQTIRRAAYLMCGLCALTLIGAWLFQLAGYQPCELCLKERIAYYVGVLLTGFAGWHMRSAVRRTPAAMLFGGLVLLFAASFLLGAYHSGVEWGLFPGPSECTGAYKPAAEIGDFLKQLETIQVVRCDAVTVRVLGLSLAVWNAVISAILTGVAAYALRLITARARYPNRDNRASSHAGNSAGTADHFDANR